MASYTVIKLKPNRTGANKGRPRWKVQWREDGSQGSRSFYSREEALAFRSDKKNGHIETGGQTVADLVDQYLQNKCPGRVAWSTLTDYSQLCRNHIVPGIGHLRVENVKYEHIEALMARVSNKPLDGRTKPAGPRTANKVRVLCGMLFKYAKRLRWIAHNPARDTDPMKERPREGIALTASEVDRLLNALEPPYFEPILLALFCGLRRGELLGLQWGDLSFPERKFRIARQRNHSHTWGTKTHAGKRVEFMSEPVEKVFRELAAKRGEVRKTDFVFLDGGQPMNGDSLLRQLRRAVNRAGLPSDFRLHDCRHTYATGLGRVGTGIRTIQQKLGHTTPAMSLKYQHAQDEASREASEKVSELLQSKRIAS